MDVCIHLESESLTHSLSLAFISFSIFVFWFFLSFAEISCHYPFILGGKIHGVVRWTDWIRPERWCQYPPRWMTFQYFVTERMFNSSFHINKRCPKRSILRFSIQTPLINAALGGNEEIVEILLQNGANINETDVRFSCLETMRSCVTNLCSCENILIPFYCFLWNIFLILG